MFPLDAVDEFILVPQESGSHPVFQIIGSYGDTLN
jgi:hypothetical protein